MLILCWQRLSPTSGVSSSFDWFFSCLCERDFFYFMISCCQLLAFISGLMESPSKHPFLRLYIVGYCLCGFLLALTFQVSNWDLWSTSDDISLQGDRFGYKFITLHVEWKFPQHHLLKMLSFLQYRFFGYFVKYQIYIYYYLYSYLGDAFCSICLQVCVNSSAILFLLL